MTSTKGKTRCQGWLSSAFLVFFCLGFCCLAFFFFFFVFFCSRFSLIGSRIARACGLAAVLWVFFFVLLLPWWVWENTRNPVPNPILMGRGPAGQASSLLFIIGRLVPSGFAPRLKKEAKPTFPLARSSCPHSSIRK
ncbi:hypothetical protein DM01DRAFT_1041213 [Hesseltinella vesiculosa]|uniref:Uncharacterized protein n=1 Tax=Hesseltinella vesiculosa TaxID=101127 RepID=A0A1X2GIN7_9FUNG|nr:hypothetical protein DM01DRAFT_1041213 [Hesseltinella vesiculosa]